MPTATPTALADRIRRRFAPEVGATSRHSSTWVSDARPRLAMRVIAWFVPPSSHVTDVSVTFELPCPTPPIRRRFDPEPTAGPVMSIWYGGERSCPHPPPTTSNAIPGLPLVVMSNRDSQLPTWIVVPAVAPADQHALCPVVREICRTGPRPWVVEATLLWLQFASAWSVSRSQNTRFPGM